MLKNSQFKNGHEGSRRRKHVHDLVCQSSSSNKKVFGKSIEAQITNFFIN